uniref:Uncharacterized protein n=1 Tax=Schistocephalus solidus TaxID=70667 RepID=A0A0X3PWA6_SCHSO
MSRKFAQHQQTIELAREFSPLLLPTPAACSAMRVLCNPWYFQFGFSVRNCGGFWKGFQAFPVTAADLSASLNRVSQLPLVGVKPEPGCSSHVREHLPIFRSDVVISLISPLRASSTNLFYARWSCQLRYARGCVTRLHFCACASFIWRCL